MVKDILKIENFLKYACPFVIIMHKRVNVADNASSAAENQNSPCTIFLISWTFLERCDRLLTWIWFLYLCHANIMDACDTNLELY